MTSRPDLDLRLPEGMCMIRLSIQQTGIDEAELIRALDRDIELGLETVKDPDLMLTIGIPFLQSMLTSVLTGGMVCRVDRAEGDYMPRLDPIRCGSVAQVEGCVEALQAMMPTPTWEAYPISIWAIPRDVVHDVDGYIERLRDERDSLKLWWQIINAGTLRMSVVEDVCSMAFDCDQWDHVQEWVEVAIGRMGLPARWIR